jgi:hypothetical protein
MVKNKQCTYTHLEVGEQGQPLKARFRILRPKQSYRCRLNWSGSRRFETGFRIRRRWRGRQSCKSKLWEFGGEYLIVQELVEESVRGLSGRECSIDLRAPEQMAYQDSGNQASRAGVRYNRSRSQPTADIQGYSPGSLSHSPGEKLQL